MLDYSAKRFTSNWIDILVCAICINPQRCTMVKSYTASQSELMFDSILLAPYTRAQEFDVHNVLE